jgi:hypothetical protein
MALGRLLTIVVLAFCGLAGTATAQSCQSMFQRLTRLDAADGGFGSAAENQRAEIARARTQLQRLGCAAGSGAPACGQVEATLAQMTQNLARLEARTRRSPEVERASLRRQLADAGCLERQATAQAPSASSPPRAQPVSSEPMQRPMGLFEMLFGGGQNQQPNTITNPPALTAALENAPRAFTPRPQRDMSERQDGGPRPPDGRGVFRTLCVRTCDGYFWPISFSTRRSTFERHAEVCRAQCPNQDVRLFVHRNAGQWSDDAVDIDGERLRDLPGAFRFRTEFDSSCACRPRFTEASLGERSEEDTASTTRGLRGSLDMVELEPEAEVRRSGSGPIVTISASSQPRAPVGLNGLRQAAPILAPGQ